MPESPFTNDSAGSAFLVAPPGGGEGPGVLLLHSWWGLDDWTRDFARRIAGEGYTVLAPDLFAGETPDTADAAEQLLAERDANEMAGLVLSSAHTTRAASADADRPIAVVGLSMGGSMALWLAARLPAHVGAVVSFYGSQSIDFDDAAARFQGHFGDADHMVSEEDRVTTEAFIRIGECDTDFHLYPGVGHWFMEDRPGHGGYDEAAAAKAWDRMRAFLLAELPPTG
ncbi:MAG: dienelactone hydrolase family protein [Acidimicrobiales bacterium]